MKRKMSGLPTKRCWKVGPTKSSITMEDAIYFNKQWNTDLQLWKHDCRHHTNGIQNIWMNNSPITCIISSLLSFLFSRICGVLNWWKRHLGEVVSSGYLRITRHSINAVKHGLLRREFDLVWKEEVYVQWPIAQKEDHYWCETHNPYKGVYERVWSALKKDVYICNDLLLKKRIIIGLTNEVSHLTYFHSNLYPLYCFDRCKEGLVKLQFFVLIITVLILWCDFFFVNVVI